MNEVMKATQIANDRTSTVNKAPKWRVYYDNGSFDSTQGEPNEAPAYGVICVVQPDNSVGRVIVQRWDYYVYRQGEWYGHHLDGLLYELMYHADEIEAVKAGRTIETNLYLSILDQANKDKDFPVKSAKKTGESGQDRVY